MKKIQVYDPIDERIRSEDRRIRLQLDKFGLKDMTVIGLRERVNHAGQVLYPERLDPQSLVHMCARRGFVGKPGHSYYAPYMSKIDVFTADSETSIGLINKEWNFLYYQAPTLEVALGWALAVRKEGMYSLADYDLPAEAEILSNLICQRDKQAFYLAAFPAMRREQYMSDCPCWSMDLLWRVGTRIIFGQEESFKVTCIHKKVKVLQQEALQGGLLTPFPGY